MSKKAEIMEMLHNHLSAFWNYEEVATEIEKLFEVEGETKIEYFLKYKHKKMARWYNWFRDDFNSRNIRKKAREYRKLYPDTEFNIFKRTIITTDKIIEE